MKILYVEDEESKIKQVIKCIKENFPEYLVEVKNSYTSAIIALNEVKYDLVLLDMSLPLYDNDFFDEDEINEFETFAGIDILEEMKRVNNFTNVIVITAFDILGNDGYSVTLEQLNEKMIDNYAPFYKGIIYYNILSLEWSSILKDYIKKLSCN